MIQVDTFIWYNYLAPGGGCEVWFSPGLSVCPANILVFYFSAIRRDIDLKFIHDTYRVVLNSLENIDLHRSMVKVTGTYIAFWRYSHITKTEPYIFFCNGE